MSGRTLSHPEFPGLRLELEELYAATPPASTRSARGMARVFRRALSLQIIPRENFERGLPLATWLCESKGYSRGPRHRHSQDLGIRAALRAPHGERHPRPGWKDEMLEVRANYVALRDAARRAHPGLQYRSYRDKLVVEDGRLNSRKALHLRQPPRPEQPDLSPLT